MQMIIDISSDSYETLKQMSDIGLGYYHEAILKGTPLLEGHGDIGDLGKLIRVMKERSDYSEASFCTLDAEDRGYTLAVHHMIEESKECVIIEADKEGGE